MNKLAEITKMNFGWVLLIFCLGNMDRVAPKSIPTNDDQDFGCPRFWIPGLQENCYFIPSAPNLKLTKEEASKQCKGFHLDASLLRVETLEEQQFIYKVLGKQFDGRASFWTNGKTDETGNLSWADQISSIVKDSEKKKTAKTEAEVTKMKTTKTSTAMGKKEEAWPKLSPNSCVTMEVRRRQVELTAIRCHDRSSFLCEKKKEAIEGSGYYNVDDGEENDEDEREASASNSTEDESSSPSEEVHYTSVEAVSPEYFYDENDDNCCEDVYLFDDYDKKK